MKISIVTVCYNSAATIRYTLESVRNQTYKNIEHIIVDGASSDETTYIINEHRDCISRIISEPDDGIYHAMNKGVQLAVGDCVGFLNSDDVFSDSEVLSDIAAAFEDPKVDVSYGDLDYVSANGPSRVIRRWRAGNFSPRKLTWGWMPPHPTLYLRRALFDKVGIFNTRYRIAGDYEHMLRVFSLPNLKQTYIQRLLVNMRVGGASNNGLRNLICKSREDYRALKENNVGGIGTLLWKNMSKISQFF